MPPPPARSRARLAVRAVEGRARVEAASAEAPQRWAIARPAADGWLEATHQFLGDGVFGGDAHRTTVEVDGGASVLVRAVSALPLRRGARGGVVTRLQVAPGASLLYVPGALIPQAGADQVHALRIDAAATSRVLAASVLVPGRGGMGEDNRYRRLRLRNVVRVDGALAFAEDATVEPSMASAVASGGPADFAGHAAAISVIALGPWTAYPDRWLTDLCMREGILGGASALRTGGACLRALAPTLGDAQRLLAAIEAAARALPRDVSVTSTTAHVMGDAIA